LRFRSLSFSLPSRSSSEVLYTHECACCMRSSGYRRSGRRRVCATGETLPIIQGCHACRCRPPKCRMRVYVRVGVRTCARACWFVCMCARARVCTCVCVRARANMHDPSLLLVNLPLSRSPFPRKKTYVDETVDTERERFSSSSSRSSSCRDRGAQTRCFWVPGSGFGVRG
jgi:hypothetical protein